MSIYKVVDNQLVFSRNVRFDIALVSWLIKSAGDYVLFSGPRNSPSYSKLRVTKQAGKLHYEIPPDSFPVSHLAPRQAWY